MLWAHNFPVELFFFLLNVEDITYAASMINTNTVKIRERERERDRERDRERKKEERGGGGRCNYPGQCYFRPNYNLKI